VDRTSLSNLNRLVRTRMLGGVGAGEGNLPGYPIGHKLRYAFGAKNGNWEKHTDLIWS
jgi:hypothetical protein